jgi:hypothetical protein
MTVRLLMHDACPASDMAASCYLVAYFPWLLRKFFVVHNPGKDVCRLNWQEHMSR